jgi:hypothetical protein
MKEKNTRKNLHCTSLSFQYGRKTKKGNVVGYENYKQIESKYKTVKLPCDN